MEIKEDESICKLFPHQKKVQYYPHHSHNAGFYKSSPNYFHCNFNPYQLDTCQ